MAKFFGLCRVIEGAVGIGRANKCKKKFEELKVLFKGVLKSTRVSFFAGIWLQWLFKFAVLVNSPTRLSYF